MKIFFFLFFPSRLPILILSLTNLYFIIILQNFLLPKKKKRMKERTNEKRRLLPERTWRRFCLSAPPPPYLPILTWKSGLVYRRFSPCTTPIWFFRRRNSSADFWVSGNFEHLPNLLSPLPCDDTKSPDLARSFEDKIGTWERGLSGSDRSWIHSMSALFLSAQDPKFWSSFLSFYHSPAILGYL